MEPTAQTSASESRLHFLDYWRIIRIRKTVILAVLLLVALTATFVAQIRTPQFKSTVRIAVNRDAPDITGLGGQPVYTGYDAYFIQTEFEKIQSRAVLDDVIDRLRLNAEWGKRYHSGIPLKTPETFDLLKARLRVAQSRNTSIIEISVLSEDKDEAALIANTIAEVYRDYRLRQRAENAMRGIKILEDRLKEQALKVGKLQESVDKLRKELNISDIDPVAAGGNLTLEPETLRRLEAKRIDEKQAYVAMEALFQQLMELKRTNPQELPKAIPTAFPDAHLATLLERLYLTEQELAKLMKDFGDANPDVQRTAALLVKIRSHVDERIEGILRGLETRVAYTKAGLDALTAEVEKAKQQDIQATAERRHYFDLKRELETEQQLVRTLGLKIVQETIDTSIPRSSIVEITDKAEPGRSPVQPNKPLIISAGIFFGLLLGIALAFFIEYLDTSVKTLDDVERALQAPVLGVIPQNVGSLVEEGPESPHAEAYRVLRSNMLFSKKDTQWNTLCVVSGGAGEGKSTTVFNLAAAFAQNGQRVIIVDSDLRRPSLHKLMKVSNAIGLTNFLLRQNKLEEVIQTTGLATLDFLPSGKLPSSSLGILNSVQMKALIHELKRRYDYVFFDSPPILGVSDASVLASEVDMTLLVVQYRKYPQAMTLRAKQMVEKVGGNLLGVVLNNINMAHDSYYYYYSGFYYDHYAPAPEQKDSPVAGAKEGSETDEPARLEQKY